MSRFYGSIQGSRGPATRVGTAPSGISGHVRGWRVGGDVVMRAGGNGADVIDVSVTHGSGGGRYHTIFQGHEQDGKIVGEVLHPITGAVLWQGEL